MTLDPRRLEGWPCWYFDKNWYAIATVRSSLSGNLCEARFTPQIQCAILNNLPGGIVEVFILRILVVDDDPEMGSLLSDLLKEEGYNVDTATSGEQALTKMGDCDYPVVISDLIMKGMPGLTLLREIKRLHPETNVIIMTAFGSIETAIQAMKEGAYDYVTKPVKSEEIVLTTRKAVQEASLRRELLWLRRAVEKEYSFNQILGKSKPMQDVFDLIRRILASPSNILITGASGTGKE